MVAVPFIYFSFLLYFLYRKNRHKIDIAMYIVMIYWLSAFFSILLDVFDLRSREIEYYNVSLNATLVYCVLLTIGVLPFVLFSTSKIKEIKKLKHDRVLKDITVFCFIFYCIVLLFLLPSLFKVLTGDFGAIRDEHYAGYDEVSEMATLPRIIRTPITLYLMITGCPWIFQFLAFYSVAIQNMRMKYFVMLLIISTIGVIQNLTQAGRSDIVYWILSFGACYIIFHPFLSRIIKKKLRFFSIALLGIFVLFLGYATISRFSDSTGGSEGGLISYAGQAYINFCYFYENFECPIPSLQLIFPLTYSISGMSLGSIVDYQKELSLITGYELGVFYTYLGQLLVTSNKMVMYSFCVMFFLFSLAGIYRKNYKEVSLAWLYKYMLFSSVMFLGLFSYFYGLPNKTFSALTFLLLVVNLNSRYKNK